MLAPGLKLLERFEELPQGLLGSARAEALALVDRLYGGKTLIFVDVTFDPTYAETVVERFGPERVIGVRITGSGDGMTVDPLADQKRVDLVYTVGRSYLFDLLLRELHDNNVRLLDGAACRRAYEQLTALEMEYRQKGMIYDCPSGRHDDLAISVAMAVWALEHPYLEYWMRAFGATSYAANDSAQCVRLDVALV